MGSNITLRSGQYAGKTVEWLEENDRGYLAWIKENRPEMLKEIKPKASVQPKVTIMSDEPKSPIQPNKNFYNEGPDKLSLPYLKKSKEDLGF
jgi:hypothetical protein